MDIKDFIAAGDFAIGTLDSKSRIAPVTQNGMAVTICLSATPDLQTPFSPWPSYDGGERTSLDLICTPELQRLAEHIDSVILKEVRADPGRWFSKTPKNLDDMHVSARRPASKEGYQDTFRTKCSFREKGASFKAWDLEKRQALTIDELKNLDWPNCRLAIVAQLSGVYFQASGYGAVVNIKSIGLRAASAECPFAFLGDDE